MPRRADRATDGQLTAVRASVVGVSMPPELAARLAAIATLSVADLVALEADLVAAFAAADAGIGEDAPTAEQDATLTELVAGLTTVREAHAAAIGRATALAAMRATATATLSADPPPAPDPVDPPVDPPAVPAALDPPAVPAQEPPVLAEPATTANPARASLAALSASRSPDNAPRVSDGAGAGQARFGLYKVAAGTGPHGRQGDRFGGWEAVGAELSHRLNRFGTRAFEPQYVASWQVDEWPEGRKLSKADPWANEDKINAVTSPSALVASGGVCNPVNVVYDVPTWVQDDRPLKASLPSFNADRGGLRFVTPPRLTDTVVTASTAVWPETLDLTPGASTKARGTILCATENEVYVDAIPTRIKVGNMQTRYSPEQVAATTKVVMAYAARVAELNLLATIATASLKTASNALLGASRDLLTSIDLGSAAYRYRQRMAPDAPLRVIMAAWAKNLLRADIARELAHDVDSQPLDPRAVPDSRIEAWFAVRNISVTWLLDGPPAGSAIYSGGPVPAAQGFGAQVTGQYLTGWPLNIRYWMFAEGSFLFLDGGQLNLGVVRDSTMDGTNDYETFVETFEAVAFRGIESLDVTCVCVASGLSAAGIATMAAPSPLDVDAAQGANGTGGSF